MDCHGGVALAHHGAFRRRQSHGIPGKADAYLLMPMLMVRGQEPQFIDGLHHLKRTLHVKLAGDVGTHDLENMFLGTRGLRPEQA